MDISAFAAVEPEDEADRPTDREPLERTHSRAMLALELALGWCSETARHTDCYFVGKLNLWRDILPPPLETGLLDRPVGLVLQEGFAAGQLLGPYAAANLKTLRDEQFDRRLPRAGLIQPRAGRFYPKGVLRNVAGIFSENRGPFRVAEIGDGQLRVDLNHPLAEHEIELSARIVDIWQPREEHGGVCHDLAELASANGPGMQARWHGRPTDFFSDLPFVRADPTPDERFYVEPRLVHHLDTSARRQIARLYGELIPPGARVLDLMSSWESHLPDALATGPVTGLGMNMEELQANRRLAERRVHDLNRDPRLSFADAAFDAVICTASVEYLTNPFSVFEEVARVLAPGGRFVVSFSNRRFPPKMIRVWEDIHEFERPGLVLEYFLRSGQFHNLETYSLRGLPRPADDPHARQTPFSDPVFAVWGETR